MEVRIVQWDGGTSRAVKAFLARPAFDSRAEEAARRILGAIRREGNRAVLRFAKRHDGVDLRAGQLRVTQRELDEARANTTPADRRAIREARRRIAAFSRAGMRRDWRMRAPRGGSLGERFTPFDRVGVYVPGGAAPLASTALMTVTLAQVAGVREIVACTPCGANGVPNPVLLHALDAAGATEVYRVGGIQAIGLMAYGTKTIRAVQKIVGPGGTYVTAAKRQVYGDVALDMVAGPSEIAVLADSGADPRHVAADLLSQLEHGTGWEKALLVTPSLRLARAAAAEVVAQADQLSRRDFLRRVLKTGLLVVVVRNTREGMELCNRFAPEHLELMVRNAPRWLREVRCAGAVFVGPWSPEAAGDFAAGPSHVLPTGGTAAMFSGLTVDDFRRRSSVIALSKADLQEMLPVIEAFGSIEGLDGHARSAKVRFE